MIETFIKLLKRGTSPNFAELVKQGAKIVDVRTKREFANGHIEGSINMPLNELQQAVSQIDKGDVIIVCCASGVRSASAKNVLARLGYNVFNGGSWSCLRHSIISK